MVHAKFFTVALKSKVIFEMAVTKELKLARFTNFGSREAPRADLHMKPPSSIIAFLWQQ